MCLELEWRCKACGERWVSDFHQIVCVACGDDRVSLNDHELIRPRPRQNICLGDLILGGFTLPEVRREH